MQEAQELKQELFRRLAAEGAAQMGVADLRGLVPSGLETGVAVLVSLPRDLAQALQTAPTRAYYAAYHTLSAQLDRIVTRGRPSWSRRATGPGLRPLRPWSRMMAGPPRAPQDGGHPGGGWVGWARAACWSPGRMAVRCACPAWSPMHPCPGTRRWRRASARAAPLRPALPWPGPHRGHLAPRPAPEALLRKEICQETQLRRMKAATGIDTDLCGLCFAVCPHTQRYLRGREETDRLNRSTEERPPRRWETAPRGALLCRGSGAAGVPWAGGLHPVCPPIFGGQNLEACPGRPGRTCLVLIPHLLGNVPDALPSVSRSRRAASSIRWCFMWAAMGWPYTALNTDFKVEVFMGAPWPGPQW